MSSKPLTQRHEPGSRRFAGLLRFIHYGFMPNHLGYCGGEDNRELLERGATAELDRGVEPLLRRFTGALPYLNLIARTNGIADPFDERVVEAYWLGNELLDSVEARQLYDHLIAQFKSQLSTNALKWMVSKAPAGARPHHNFHVFDVHSRVGELGMTLETMDACRISWGRVSADRGFDVLVERQELELSQGKLRLANPRPAMVYRQLDGLGFVQHLQPGDWVALHWSWVCEKLTFSQVDRLRRFTEHHLALANQTL